MNRRVSRQIKLGKKFVGGGAPITIQSMTMNKTTDIKAVLKEIDILAKEGCDIVRLGIPDEASAKAVSEIKKRTNMTLVADIHFDHKLALISLDGGIDGLRINPGNIKKAEYIMKIVEACRDRKVPIRIGVNSGSLDRSKYLRPSAEAMVESAMGHIKILEDLEFYDIKVSLKSSDVMMMIDANRLFCDKAAYPLHLGVTEAGDYEQSVIKSSIGIGSLLANGIGDTIRVSITGDTVNEVRVAKVLLRSLGLRNEGIEIISCPTCARKEFDVLKAVKQFKEKTKDIKTYLKVAIMGCVVNGPGEAREADIGVAVGKDGAVIFKKGEIIKKVKKDKIIDTLVKEIKEE